MIQKNRYEMFDDSKEPLQKFSQLKKSDTKFWLIQKNRYKKFTWIRSFIKRPTPTALTMTFRSDKRTFSLGVGLSRNINRKQLTLITKGKPTGKAERD